MTAIHNYTLMQYVDFCMRIFAACMCGAVIGFERTKRYKMAGIRTHIIVCCGAALIMVVSINGFEGLQNLTGVRAGDPARLAAQVVSGIGFLGAGVIFKHGKSVQGLTTAAGLWTTAAIGLAMGAGMYVVAIFTTILVGGLQIIMHRHIFSGDSPISYCLKFVASDTKGLEKQLREQMFHWHARITDTKISENANGDVEYEINFVSDRLLSYEDIHRFFVSNEDIKDVSIKQ